MFNDKIKKTIINGIMVSTYIQYNKIIETKNDTKDIKIDIDPKIFTNSIFVEQMKNLKEEEYKKLYNYFSHKINLKSELSMYSNNDYEQSIELMSLLIDKKISIGFNDELIIMVSLLNKFYKEFNITEKDQSSIDILTMFIYLEESNNVLNLIPTANTKLLQFLNEKDFKNLILKIDYKEEDENSYFLVKLFESHLQEVHELLNKYINKNDDILKEVNVKDYNSNDFYFRKKELNDIIYNLFKMNNNNIILYGKKGIGKRRIVYSLPHYIKKEKIKYLKHTKYYTLDILDLLKKSNNKEEEEKDLLISIHASLDAIKDQKDTVVIIDLENTDINGDKNRYSDNHFQLLYDYIYDYLNAFPNISVIFISDNEDISDDFSNNGVFSKQQIIMPSQEELKKILMLNKIRYEIFFNVKLSEDNIDYIMNLVSSKKVDSILSYLDFLDMILAKAIVYMTNKKELSNEEIQFYYELGKSDLIINKELEVLANELKSTVYGQDEIIDQIMNKFEIYKSGLKEKNKPIAAFMFAGSSGIGKTELARQLSINLNLNLIRLDMTEFQEAHSISKILGSPAGYIGYDSSGSVLLKEIINKPHSILLLDEIEKAHPNVVKLFLQVLDEAELRGSSGEKANFSNMIILFTTNAGARTHSEKQTGFLIQTEQKRLKEELKKHFPIEFINRLDDIMAFNDLDKVVIEKIIYKEIKKILNLLHGEINLDIKDNAKEYLIKEAFDKELGARKAKRTIDKEIKLLIAKEINKLKNKKIEKVTIDYIDNKFLIEVC